MNRRIYENPLQRRSRLKTEFSQEWSWYRVFQIWYSEFKKYGMSIQPLFLTIVTHDPENPIGRKDDYGWLPNKEIEKYRIDLQRHFDKHPGTLGPIHKYLYLKGEEITLDLLWYYRNDTEKIAAVLMSASLFSRHKSSRGRGHRDNWPDIAYVEALDALIYDQWYTFDLFLWQHYHTEVLPYQEMDYDYNIQDIAGLIRYFAAEHVGMLRKHRPLQVVFQSARDPFIHAVLENEYQQERQQIVALEKSWAAKRVAMQEREKKLKKWNELSKSELEHLVWTKPTTSLAKLFNVSDVAISKRCKSWGILKPWPGFWAEVASGKLPHPNGKPVQRQPH